MGEVIEGGPAERRSPGRRGTGGRSPLLALAAVLLPVAVLGPAQGAPSPADAHAGPGPHDPARVVRPPDWQFSGTATGTGGTGSGPGYDSTVTMTWPTAPLLGVTARWEVFAGADSAVVRIQPALGRITVTTAPTAASLPLAGAVRLVVGAHSVLISSAEPAGTATAGGSGGSGDDGGYGGYEVNDGGVAVPLPAALGGQGPLLPGPDLEHVWVQSAGVATPVLQLTTLDGTAAGAAIVLPPGLSGQDPAPDGAGSLLLSATGAVYDLRPGRPFLLVTRGSVVAAGRTSWLVVECTEGRCRTLLRDRAGHTVTVPGTGLDATTRTGGVIAPDGRTAAVFTLGPGRSSTLTLLDLVSGRRRPVDLTADPVGAPGTVAWSPDSSRLFAVDGAGRLVAVDGATAAVTALPGLPPVTQVAVRSE